MGRKRKRAPTKQSWASTSSRKQKKRRKTRGHALNQAKVPKEVDGSQVKLSNTTDSKMLELIAREKSSSSCNLTSCTFPHDNSLKIWKFFGISAVISRFNSFASMFQCSTMECFRSIRNVFLLLNWFKQIFGCGLQTLGKFLLAEKDHLNSTDKTSHFEDMMKRMENLENEVKLLKSELVKKTACSCGDHNSTGSATQEGYAPPSLPCLPIPPPPPPPPPPPILPPAAPPLAFLKKKQTGSKAIDSNENKNKPSKTLVTLEDLKKVKLRKVKQVDENDKENVQPESETTSFKLQPKKVSLNKQDLQCVVSLREIKKVTLKRTKKETELEKMKLRTPEEMVVTRRNLRKVNITRSPGGTPLVSGKSCEHGTGLTPMMTKALRRKFQNAHPYSSPDSPTGKQKRQSFSPMAGSPNTPSPLLFR